MANPPLVSIIVPVYNAHSHIKNSIQTLQKQTLADIEILVVNDCSTDNTKNVVEEIAKVDNRVICINLPQNQGVHEARLVGLKHARAPWIGFLDSDDFARPNMFESMHKAATNNRVDIVTCGSFRVTPSRKSISPKVRFKKNKKVSSAVFQGFCQLQFGTGTLWNRLYRREVIMPFSGMHFPWRQSTNEDVLLNAACFYRAKSVYLMKDILHEYMENEESVTAKIDKVKAFVEIYSAFALAVDFFKGCDNKTLISIVDLYRNQFLRWDLQIYDLATLSDLQPKIVAATELAYKASPLSLGLLVARSSRVDFFVKVKMYLKRFVKKLLQGPLYKGR